MITEKEKQSAQYYHNRSLMTKRKIHSFLKLRFISYIQINILNPESEQFSTLRLQPYYIYLKNPLQIIRGILWQVALTFRNECKNETRWSFVKAEDINSSTCRHFSLTVITLLFCVLVSPCTCMQGSKFEHYLALVYVSKLSGL